MTGGGSALETPHVVPSCDTCSPGPDLRWHALGEPACDPSHSHAQHPTVAVQSAQHPAKLVAFVHANAFCVHETLGNTVRLHCASCGCSSVAPALGVPARKSKSPSMNMPLRVVLFWTRKMQSVPSRFGRGWYGLSVSVFKGSWFFPKRTKRSQAGFCTYNTHDGREIKGFSCLQMSVNMFAR